MRTISSDPPRRRVARSACGLALVLALAHGTTGCAHQQLTNADLAVGVITAAAVVGGLMLISVHCNELTTQCRPSGGDTGRLAPDAPPPLTGLRAGSGR